MSLYKRLHEVQEGSSAATATKRRDPVLDELRQRIHHHLIDELGPILYDKRLSEDDLRRRVHEQLHAALAQERAPLSAADKAHLIPAAVHVDGTARIQTIDATENPLMHRCIRAFEARTDLPVIVNTSLNTAGRPMVDDPRDALECFGSAPIDALAIGPFLVRRGAR